MYLVTGGAGFIGSHLVRALVQQGKCVRVLDNESSGTQRRLADVVGDVEWRDGDIRDRDTVHRACTGVEIVLHHAAISSVPRSIREPFETHATNVVGTLNVLEAARDAGVKRVVFASSSAVYGTSGDEPLPEDAPLQPQSPYGVQKLCAEQYCRLWPTLSDTETVCLRYFNVFGSGQDPQSEYAAVIPRFIEAALRGRTPTIYGDGEQSRDFVDVSDVTQVTLLAAVAPAVSGMVFNVGTGTATKIKDLVQALSFIVGWPIHPAHAPARVGDIRASLADITLMRARLGYTPSVSLATGLERVVRDMAQHHLHAQARIL